MSLIYRSTAHIPALSDYSAIPIQISAGYHLFGHSQFNELDWACILIILTYPHKINATATQESYRTKLTGLIAKVFHCHGLTQIFTDIKKSYKLVKSVTEESQGRLT